MPVRTTVDIPDLLHDRLRKRAEKSGASIRSLIVRAIEQTYPGTNKTGSHLTGPLIQGSGKLGPAFPKDENPHEFIFS
jgi:metal-responsive CopG/Arc/MetJ family transcriptional regulator